MILVTGASGNLGTAVLENLLNQWPSSKMAGLYRDANKGTFAISKGIDVRIGDYSDKTSLVKALEGVEKLLLISSSSSDALTDHKNVIDAAKEVGVQHIFYTSGVLNEEVEQSKLGPLADSYVTTENYIIESGLTYTILQNGLYAETIPFFVGERVLETSIYFPAGDGRASFAKRTEMGEAIANVLAGTGHENKIYLITSHSTYSFGDIAIMLSELSGKDISYVSPDPEEYEARLRGDGVEETDIWFLSLLAAVIKNDEYKVKGTDLEQFLGRKPTDLKTYLKEAFLG